MKKIILLSAILIIFTCIHSFGQFRPMYNYPSPNAASLGNYGNIPINLHTGNPNIHIPLYEIKEGDISLPISMNYHLASLKPNQKSDWTGLGWNLSAGGCITRNVRGTYDEQQYEDGTKVGFYYHYAKLKDVNDSTTLVDHIKNYIGDGNVEVYELMSDEYSFSFGQYSGSFYLDEYGNWIVISDHDIKVTSVSTRTLADLRSKINTKNWNHKKRNNCFFDTFTLITPDGVKYTFGGKDATEYSISYYNRNNRDLVATSWFLTNITSPKGYTISLSYEAGDPICEIQFAAFSSFSYIPAQGSGFIDKWLAQEASQMIDNRYGRKRLSGYLIFPVYLKEIKSTYADVIFYSFNEKGTTAEARPNPAFMAWNDYSETVQTPFEYSSYDPKNQFHIFMPTNDIKKIQEEYINWRVLEGISIVPNITEKNTTDFTKTFYFSYICGQEERRKLKSITEKTGEYSITTSRNNTGRIYEFDYNIEEKFTRYIFADVDHWGYFKGGEGTFTDKILFDQPYYESREPTSNIKIAQAETLKEITYPTGGKTKFKYKLNRYSKIVPASLSTELKSENGIAGGVCIAEIADYDNNDKLIRTKKYYYTDTKPSNNNYKTSGILKTEKIYVMNYFTKDGETLALASEGGFLSRGVGQTDAHITYSKIIEEIFNADGVSEGYSKYEYTNYDKDLWENYHMDQSCDYTNVTGVSYSNPSSSKSMERGKLLSIEHFNASGKKVKSQEYKYSLVNDGDIKIPYQEVVTFYSSLEYYLAGYLTSMTKAYTGRYFIQKQIETFYNSSTGAKMQSIEKDFEYNKHKLLVSETTHKDASEKLETKFQYMCDYISEYTEENNKCWNTYQQELRYAEDTYHRELYECQRVQNRDECERVAKMNYDYYVEQTKAVYQNCESRINNLYNNGIDYEGKVSEAFSVNSIIQQNLVGMPLATIKLVHKDNSIEIIDGEIILYHSPKDNIIVPAKRLIFNDKDRADIPDSKYIWLNYYDDRFLDEDSYKYNPSANICEIINKNGLTTSYIWSYKGHCPIAEITNVTYEEIENHLGKSFLDGLLKKDPSASDLQKINQLRQQFPKALVTTYTYAPYIGILSKTDCKGVTTHYKYDSLARLEEIYYFENEDQNKKRVIEKYNYNYKVK